MNKDLDKGTENSISLKTNLFGFPVWLWIAFLCLALIKLFLVSEQSLTAYGDVGHDDRLFINLAQNILSFHWLGDFNQMTLAKGPFHSIWIAFTHFLGIPLLASQNFLYIGACLLLILSLKSFFSSRPFLTIFSYTILLFNPAGIVTTRVVREGIYPSLTLLVIAFSFGLLVRFLSKEKTAYLWSVGLGISLSCFWLTREEGIWVVPLLAIIFLYLIFTLFKKYKNKDKKLVYNSLLIALPFLILGLSLIMVSFVNYTHYGIFNTVEFKNKDFLRAYGSLTRVENANWRQYIPVPKETRTRIYDVSPSFSELKPYLEGDVGNNWANCSNEWLNIDSSEIAGGWFMWAFRDAIASAGYYKNGEETMNFYKQMADEIDSACSSGKFDCSKNNQSMTPHWRDEYLGQLVPHFFTAAKQTLWFTDISSMSGPSVGKESSLKLFQDTTNESIKSVANQGGDQLEISGWAFSLSDKIMLSVVDENDNVANSSVVVTEGKDVYDSFAKQGIVSENALKSRFTITTNCVKDCFLLINEKNGNNKKIPLSKNYKNAEGSKDIFYNIDTLINQASNNSSANEPLNFKIKILEFIKKLYSYALVPFLIISFLILLREILAKKLEDNDIILILLSLSILSIAIFRILIITLIAITSFPAINGLYLSSVYPPLLIFIFLPLLFSLQKNISKKTA